MRRPLPFRPLPARSVLVGGLLCAALAGCGERQTEAERLFDEGHARIEQGDHSAGVAILQRVLDEHPDSSQAANLRENWRYYEELLAIEAERGPVQATRDLRRLGEALEQHRRRRRAYPEDLAALVPGFVEAVGVDPWDRPYSYRRRGRGYVLETLGADGAAGGSGADRDIRLVDGIMQNAAPAGLRDAG